MPVTPSSVEHVRPQVYMPEPEEPPGGGNSRIWATGLVGESVAKGNGVGEGKGARGGIRLGWRTEYSLGNG